MIPLRAAGGAVVIPAHGHHVALGSLIEQQLPRPVLDVLRLDAQLRQLLDMGRGVRAAPAGRHQQPQVLIVGVLAGEDARSVEIGKHRHRAGEAHAIGHARDLAVGLRLVDHPPPGLGRGQLDGLGRGLDAVRGECLGPAGIGRQQARVGGQHGLPQLLHCLFLVGQALVVVPEVEPAVFTQQIEGSHNGGGGVLHPCIMADLNEKLQKLHEAVVDLVTDRLENPVIDEETGMGGVSNEDLRVALALLKQNGVTAPVVEDSRISLASQLAGKLDFKGLQDKRPVVVPLRREIEPSAG